VPVKWCKGTYAVQALERLRELPSLVDVPVPAEEHITVCGDVHGQYYDLLNIFELNGLPSPQNPYLFNGMLQPTPSSACRGISAWMLLCHKS